MPFRTAVAAVAAAFVLATPVAAQDADAARADLAAAAQALIQPSNAERLRMLTELLTAAGLPYEIQAFEGGNGRTGPMAGSNVVVTVGEGDRDIVLSAHYDAVVLRDGSLAHGVVDNAGSVLALIEVARTLRDAEAGHRFVFVFTDQEELGLIGARKWIEANDKARIRAAINLDVNAWGESLMYGENVGEQSAFVLRAMRLQCAERAVDCVAFPNYPPSDDRAFSAAGVPVISIGSQDAVGARQMWLAFNGGQDNGLREGFVPTVFQRIHSADDRIEHFNGADVARTAAFVADLALRLDRGGE